MNHPYLFIAGVSLFSYMAPEILAVFGARVPVSMNMLSLIAGGLIAASFVL